MAKRDNGIEIRQGQYGEYQAVFYNTAVQRFVLDHLGAILEQKQN